MLQCQFSYYLEIQWLLQDVINILESDKDDKLCLFIEFTLPGNKKGFCCL